MRIEDKFSEDLIDYIKEMAKDDYDSGHPFDYSDIIEFKHILRDDGFNVSTEDAKELMAVYFNAFDTYKESNYM